MSRIAENAYRTIRLHGTFSQLPDEARQVPVNQETFAGVRMNHDVADTDVAMKDSRFLPSLVVTYRRCETKRRNISAQQAVLTRNSTGHNRRQLLEVLEASERKADLLRGDAVVHAGNGAFSFVLKVQ